MKLRLVGVLMAAWGAALSALAGYSRLDFMASAGSSDTKCSWVNTGYKPTCTDRIEMKVRFLNYSKTQNLFCSRTTNGNNSMTAFFINNSGYKIRYDRGASGANVFSTKVFTSAADGATDHLIIYDGNEKKGYVDASSVALSTTTSTYTPGSQMTLFASHSGTAVPTSATTMGNYSAYRFYYCRVYDKNGKLIHNFVPARDDAATSGSTAQCGVWDTVDNTFHANLGKQAFDITGATALGTLGEAPAAARTVTVSDLAETDGVCTMSLNFTAGLAQHLYCAWGTSPGGETTNSWEHVDALTDVAVTETTRTFIAPAEARYLRFFLHPVIAGAKPLVSIHSSGQNEYIDTGFTPSSTTRADLKFSYDSDYISQYCVVFGARKSNTYQFFTGANMPGNYWYRRYGSQLLDNMTGNPVPTGDHVFSLDHNQFTLDSASTTMTRSTNFTCVCSAYLFAVDDDGAAKQFAKMSLTSCSIWDDGALVRNYVPCVTDDGVPTLYESVSGTFAENKGTTAFTAGDELWTQSETVTAGLSLAVTATWTGKGDGTSATDGANWLCVNALGNELPTTTLPTEETELYIAGDVALNCPTALPHKSVAFGANTTLTADCDWRGLGTLNLTGRVDVAGHTLSVADLSGTAGEITDSTGWTELDSLWLLGGQHLITDVTPACTDRVETEVTFSGTGTYCPWCVRGTTTLDGTMSCFVLNGAARFDRNYAVGNATNNPPVGEWTKIVADYRTLKVTIDGVESCTMTGGSFTPGSKLCLFASHYNGETVNVNNRFSGYMRYFRLYAADGTLKLDLVPRMRNADSVCGMYDRVTGTFYTGASALRMGGRTSTEAVGVLRLDIPAGTVCTNNGVVLNGGLAVVKEGAGTWYQAQTGNSFAGGFHLAAGRVELPVSGSSSTTYGEINRLFGAYGAPVVIDAGATFDGRGNYDFRLHPLTLAGTLANTGCDMNGTMGGYDLVQLGGDATIDADFSMPLAAKIGLLSRDGVQNLNGHTLTIDVGSGHTVCLTSTQAATYTNGTIVARAGGSLVTLQPCEMRTVDLVQQDAGLRFTAAVNVRNYTVSLASDLNTGTADLNVYGTFTPLTDYFYGATLQDGAAIDLSARTATWSVTNICASGRTTVTFAEGAAITVNLGSRTPALGEKIIAWTEKPKATFAWDDAGAHAEACLAATDGLYYGDDPASTVVDRALWTGAAKDGNFGNPANWSCLNRAGSAIADALPAATGTLVLDGSAPFDFTSAQWLPIVDEPADAVNKSATICVRIPLPLTDAWSSYAFLDYPLDDYLYLGPTDLRQLRDATWLKNKFVASQLRFEGWFNVTDEQAGTWTLRAGMDNYVGVAFDGTWVVTNNTWTATATASATVNTGWHRFTVVCGDTGGGYGNNVTIGDVTSVLGVSINGGTEVAFEDAFTFGSGTVPDWCAVEVKGGALPADCNVCALRSLPIDGTLDLNGHALRVNALAGMSGVVTNTAETVGTLTVSVPERATRVLDGFTLGGALKLVKTGLGTLKLTHTAQTYTAGTEVAAGTLQAGAAGTTGIFGAAGSEIRVAADAIFDVAGQTNWQDYTLRLQGGAMRSSSDGSATGNGFASVTLDADSIITNSYSSMFVGGPAVRGLLDLNGHTLNVGIVSGKYIYINNSTVTNGMLNGVAGGHLVFDTLTNDLSTVQLAVTDLALGVKAPTPIRDYSSSYAKNYSVSLATGSLHVLGTFKPCTAYYDQVELQDGATLDLTAQTGTWSATSLITATFTHTCTFAQGAHITVNCAGRTLAAGDKLVAWSALPSGVRFTLDATSAAALGSDELTATSAGLYVGGGLTWKGGDGALATLANWQTTAGGTPTTLNGQSLLVTGPSALTSAQKLTYAASTLKLKGTVSFRTDGGLYCGGLDLAANARLVIDPLAYTLRFLGAPTFADGAKIALAPVYAEKTKGRFLLMTWDTGTVDSAAVADLFDTSSTAAGASATLTVETLDAGGRLWLDLAPATAKPTINVLFFGDGVTAGDATSDNYRIRFVKELEADGYAVQTKGFWQRNPYDLADATMPDAWTRHSADSSMAFGSTTAWPGYLEAIANVLEQAGDVDLVVFALGSNDLALDAQSLAPEEVIVKWEALVTRIRTQKPHAKILSFNVLPRTSNQETIDAYNALLEEKRAAETFEAKQVAIVDAASVVPRTNAQGTATGLWYSYSMPSRMGMAKIGAAAAATARTLIAADADWEPGIVETPVVSRGAEANVPAAERAGFTMARTYDLAAHNNAAVSDGVTYDEEGEGVITNIGRVAWYVELKRPNGSTRWLWAAADAWGKKTIDWVGIPVKSAVSTQTVIGHLRVQTNMPGLDNTPDGSYDRGAVEFSRYGYGVSPATNNGLPTAGWGDDWNDTLGSGSFGTMQVHRFTPNGLQAGETLFAFNHWVTGSYYDIGLGNFANKTIGSTDWTYSGSNTSGIGETMGVRAYEVARLEIWTMPAEALTNEVVTALWTGAAGTSDATDPANWSCTNAVGEVVADAVPDAGTTVILAGEALAFTPPATPYLGVTLGDCTLAADLDLRNAGLVRVEGTVDLAGHQLALDRLVGGGTITDSAVFDLTTTDTTRASSTTTFYGGVAANLFNNNYSFNGTDNSKRVIVEKANLPLVVDYDFGTPTTIDAYRLWVGPLAADVLARAPSAWAIEGSNDGTTWTTVDSRADVYWNVNVTWGRICSLEHAVTYRWYRLRVTDCPDAGYLQVCQLEYGRQSDLGTLLVDVPAATTTAQNSDVMITGQVRFVKAGLGKFVAAKATQEYWSSQVAAGTMQVAQAGSNKPVGRFGAEIEVGAAGTFDLNGKGGFDRYDFVLDGGTLKNSVALTTAWGAAQVKSVRLGADSTVVFDAGTFISSAYTDTTIDLRGHTLTATANAYSYFANTHLSAGTLKLYGPWEAYKYNAATAFYGSEATVEMYGRLGCNSPVTLGDYLDRTTLTSTGTMSNTLTVVRRFQPTTQYFYGCTLADGATLDLTALTGTNAWNTASLVTSTTRTNVTFAANATITVDIHGRKFRSGNKVVAWHDSLVPENLDTLTFKVDEASASRGYRLVKASDGVYLDQHSTIILIR